MTNQKSNNNVTSSKPLPKKSSRISTKAVILYIIKASLRAKTGHSSPNSNPRGQGKMYLSIHLVMKIKTVKPEKAAGIENSVINAARNGSLKNRLT